MQRIGLIIIIVFGMVFPCFAQGDTVASLIEEAQTKDGQAVILEGEVIGDVMFRNDMAWLNISDETGAIGVWISAEEAKKIKVVGDYKHQGDKITVSGIFYRALKEQDGEMAIAGEYLQIREQGQETLYPLKSKRIIALGLLALVTALIYLFRIKYLGKRIAL